jgi:hypothetical protein
MLEKQTRKLDLLKAGPGSSAKSKSKKVERLENHLKTTVTKELQMVRLKQMFVVSSASLFISLQLFYISFASRHNRFQHQIM